MKDVLKSTGFYVDVKKSGENAYTCSFPDSRINVIHNGSTIFASGINEEETMLKDLINGEKVIEKLPIKLCIRKLMLLQNISPECIIATDENGKEIEGFFDE